MPLYNRKPLQVEAVRWDGERYETVPPWLAGAILANKAVRTGNEIEVFHKNGRNSSSVFGNYDVCRAGDYVVRYPDGTIRPMGFDQFEAMFQPAKPEPAFGCEHCPAGGGPCVVCGDVPNDIGGEGCHA